MKTITAAEAFTKMIPKKRHPVKPHTTSELQNIKSHSKIPRKIRLRNERTSFRRTVKKVVKQKNSMTKQELVRSNSGKVAYGPWLGPYGSKSESKGQELMYLDRQGSVHSELDETKAENNEIVVIDRGHRKGTALVPVDHRPTILTNQDKKLHLKEQLKLQEKPYINRFGGLKYRKQLRHKKNYFSNANCTAHIIQPKRGF